ncbi:hypothetical protein TWF481_007735 [Arthrobotrys musiformis]|uniref:C3H1-type domain-containing protein n=1 Tax=Arthrobotrys musiformis TaxID=47236 RepID=A0AAV9WCE3_9PEZI
MLSRSNINPSGPRPSSTSRPGRQPACKYFTKGRCTRGDSCQFYHDPNFITDSYNDNEDFQIVEVDLSDLESLGPIALEALADGYLSLSESKPNEIAYKKYQHPPTPSTQILSFKDQKSYNKSRLTPAYTHLQFGSGFRVTNTHIQDLLSCPQMLANLEVFMIKGVDGTTTTTGKGKNKKTKIIDPVPIEITNEPFITVIRKCRNLRVLHLIGCVQLDDYAFKAIAQSCPDLVEMKLTGTPTQPGSLTTASPVYIVTKGQGTLTSIREIHLTNQSISSEGITLLSDCRPMANILEGLQQQGQQGQKKGLTLTSLEGTRVHHSSYIVALGDNKLKFKDCFAPNWDVNKGEQPDAEAVERLLAGADRLPGFWASPSSSCASSERGEEEEEGKDGPGAQNPSDEEGEEGIHHVEIVKGGGEDTQRLSDDLIAGLTNAIRRLHRNIDESLIIRDEDRFEELE